MHIKMRETQDGSIDGISISTYQAGETYDLTESEGARALASVFVNEMEVADEVDPLEQASPGADESQPQTDADQPAPDAGTATIPPADEQKPSRSPRTRKQSAEK